MLNCFLGFETNRLMENQIKLKKEHVSNQKIDKVQTFLHRYWPGGDIALSHNFYCF